MKQNYTHIAVLLDSSGSMGSCYTDTVNGFNRFLADQKGAPGEATLTLRTFADLSHVVHNRVNINHVADLSRCNYSVGGSTALVDSLVDLIDQTGNELAAMPENQRPSKVVVLVITDGQENCSRRFNNHQLKDRIEHQKSRYQWEFVFMGADQNAIQEAQRYGYAAASAMTFSKSPDGISAGYMAVSTNLRSMRAGSKADMTFTTDQRDQQTAAGVDPSLNQVDTTVQP